MPEPKQAIIKVVLIGTEGQLDLPEEEYGVRYLEDAAEQTKQFIISLKEKYPNFGWTVTTADKDLNDEEYSP